MIKWWTGNSVGGVIESPHGPTKKSKKRKQSITITFTTSSNFQINSQETDYVKNSLEIHTCRYSVFQMQSVLRVCITNQCYSSFWIHHLVAFTLRCASNLILYDGRNSHLSMTSNDCTLFHPRFSNFFDSFPYTSAVAFSVWLPICHSDSKASSAGAIKKSGDFFYQ